MKKPCTHRGVSERGSLDRSQRRLACASTLLALALLAATAARAQSSPTLPLSLDQNAFLYRTFPTYRTNTPPLINWQSLRGVPISTNVGAGSDGRAPTLAQQITNNPTTTLPPSPGQFRGFVPLSAVAVQRGTNLNASQNFAANVGAGLLNWPRLENGQGQVVAILRASQVGAPYLQKLSSQPFGSVLSPPLTDERGNTLTNQPNYWFVAPFPPG